MPISYDSIALLYTKFVGYELELGRYRCFESVSVLGTFFGIVQSRYGIRYRYRKIPRYRYRYFRIHISYKTYQLSENIDLVVIGVVV